LVERRVKKPNPLIMSVGMWVLGLLNKKYKVEFTYDYDPKQIEGKPTVLLSSHAARLEFLYTVYGFKRRDINLVCGYQNIMKKGIYRLLMRLGIISKYLYQPDMMCVKNMVRVLKGGGAIGLFPEGIQSTSGSTHPINPATARFIKKSKANIVVCTTRGAYLATNRYSSDRKKGYIGVEYSLLFTPEMLDGLSEEEIYRQLLQKISYNDFAYNRTARNAYVGKLPNAHGLEKILYICPDCKKEHTLRVENDTVACTHCGFRVRVDECYCLTDYSGNARPLDIDVWYKWQRSCVAKTVQDEGFEMSLSGSLCTLRTDKLLKPPKNRKTEAVGKAVLSRQGLMFVGAKDGKEVQLFFEAESVYSLTFSSKGFLEFYYKDEYYMLIPDEEEKQCLIKWTLASEEIHNLTDEKWRSACADVYGLDEGDIYG
ncbi:MAG: hypothetical protein IJF71_06595, partial [Clostridia bacterium]|nr:hypothetical protein [Clostridia bacterium]